MTEIVELLTPPTNYAVVRLPGRKFPGVVFQGDSLHSMLVDLSRIRTSLRENDLSGAADTLNDVLDQLQEVIGHFEMTCTEKGIELPYPKS